MNKIGFLISPMDNPILYIPIISLSLDNFKNDKTKPKIIKKGRVTYIKFGIINKAKLNISIELICKWLITLNSLVICINQVIDTKIKKTSVQDLII